MLANALVVAALLVILLKLAGVLALTWTVVFVIAAVLGLVGFLVSR